MSLKFLRILFPTLMILTGLSCNRQTAAPKLAPGEMVQEWIYMERLENGDVLTRVDYIFKGNFTGKEKIAFPETEWFEFKAFKAWWNSEPLTVEKETAPSGGYYAIGDHRFTALYKIDVVSTGGRLHEMRNEYIYTPPFYAPGTKSEETGPVGKYIEYILVTGATWNQKIGRVEATFVSRTTCDKIHELADSVHGVCKNGIWKFIADNIEPDRNIRLVVEK